jgi:hypothetical protein
VLSVLAKIFIYFLRFVFWLSVTEVVEISTLLKWQDHEHERFAALRMRGFLALNPQ